MKRSAPLKRGTKPLKRAAVVKRAPLKRSGTSIPKKRKGPARRGRGEDPKYLAWIRTLPCVVCNGLEDIRRGLAAMFSADRIRSEAAHIGVRGLGQKCPDRQTAPLCMYHHTEGPESHHVLGKRFWAHHGLDPKAIIAELNRLYDKQEKPHARKP